MQRAEQFQRIHVAVERAIEAARDLRPDVGQELLRGRVIQHLVGVGDHLGLVVQPLHLRDPALLLVVGEREHQPARPLMRDVDAGLVLERRCEGGPGVGRPHRPGRVGRHAEALRLHPDQREIPARGAIGIVAFVQDRHALAEPREAPGNRGADQPAADNGDFRLLGHRPAPMNSRSSP
jgi:hypothetical protein